MEAQVRRTLKWRRGGWRLKHGFSLDFDCIPADEIGYFDQRVGGPRVAEIPAVDARHGFPVAMIAQIYARPDDVLQLSAEGFDAGLDLVQNIHRLGSGILRSDHLARPMRRGCPADENPVTDAHGSTVACQWLPDAAAVEAQAPGALT